MDAFLSFTVIGIVYGCIYALTACGIVVTYTTSGIFNFAHGAIGMAGAYTYWQFRVGWGWPTWAAVVMVLFVIAPVFGVVIERVLMRPLHGAPVDLTVVITLGLLLMLLGVSAQIWDPTKIRILADFFPGNSVNVLGSSVEIHKIIVIIVGGIVAVTLRYFFARTRTGIAMRAVVDNPDLVAMAGATPQRIQQLSWALGCSLAALSGVLLAPIRKLDIILLTLAVINGYAAAMVGRLRNLPMTIVGALMIGLGQTYAVGYFEWQWLKELQLIIPMVLLFIVLIVLPQAQLRLASGQATHAAPRPGSGQSSIVWAVALVVGAVIVSGQLSQVNLAYASKGMALAIVLLSLVLLTGYGGLTSLCQMTFVGIGGYAMAKVGPTNTLLGLLAAGVLAAAVGVLVALPTLRLRGLYLALATLAFAQAMDELFFVKLFGFGGSLDVPRLHIPGFPETDAGYFVQLAVLFAIASVGLLAIRRGKWGRRLTALDDSPAACATLGLNVNYTKLAVFSAAAGIAGMGGALLGGVPGQISSNEFGLLLSLVLLLLARIGGINTMSGAFLGAMFFATFPIIQEKFPALAAAQFLLTGVGAISLGRRPNGVGGDIAHIAEQLQHRWASRRAGPPAPADLPTDLAEEDELAFA